MTGPGATSASVLPGSASDDDQDCRGVGRRMDELQVSDSSISSLLCTAEPVAVKNDDLPLEDIVMDILSRLPVKALIRFKLVSRDWDAIIPNSPRLVSMHLKNYTRNPATKQPSLIFCYTDALNGLDNRTVSFSPDLQPINLDKELCSRVICSAGEGGVLLLGNPNLPLHNYCLWNPATRQIRHLPDPYSQESGADTFAFHFEDYRDQCGVGLDLVTNDIKVVLVRHCLCWFPRPHEVWDYSIQVLVYTLRSNCWRELQAGHSSLDRDALPYLMSSSPTYFNGSFYWLSQNLNLSHISVFDMGIDVFRKINCPFRNCFPALNKMAENVLCIYRDSLAVLLHQLNFAVEVWLLNGDGVDWCWSKRLTLGPFPQRFYVEMVLDDDQLIADCVDSSELVLVNASGGVEQVVMQNCFWSVQLFMYKETLVSIN